MVNDFKTVNWLLNRLNRIFDDNTNKWYYLYAITNNSKYAETFEDTHDNKLFIRREKTMSKKQYEIFRKENDYAELILYSTRDDDESEKILCTKGESYDIGDSFNNYINVEIVETTGMEYLQFIDEYVKALDQLGYCQLNRCNGDDYDYYCTQMSYGCTPEGYKYPPVNVAPNKVTLYLKLYALLLRKDEYK